MSSPHISRMISAEHPFLSRREGLMAGLALVLATFRGTAVEAGPAAWSADHHPFLEHVKVSVDGDFLVVESDGIPNHKTAVYPNADNPNRILRQEYRFRIPLKPAWTNKPTRLPMGPIGVAINGIPFYNPYNAEGRNAVEGPWAEVFDSCCGHPDPAGRYHYHKYPVCVKSPFKDPQDSHSPIIGLAFDGYPVYGPKCDGGKSPVDLDDCNGHRDDERGYHYHVTTRFPYILGAYRGEVDMSNFDGPQGGPRRRRGPGGPGLPPGPPPGRLPPPPKGS